MIRNVVFDMGQVLIRWRPAVLTQRLGLSEEDDALLTRELFQNVEWVMLDRGVITPEEVTRRVCARLPERLHGTVARLTSSWWEIYLDPVPGMAELVGQLKAAGCGIYLLSNASVALRTYFPRIPGSAYFDGIMVSAEEKLVKPQPEIFRLLCDRFRLNPAECVFVDDSPANVESAILTGMDGLVFFGDAQRLRRELTEKGVPLS